MVACWRYSPDDISIMGLHCRQTHYKPAIRGNTGDSTTHSNSTPWSKTKTPLNMWILHCCSIEMSLWVCHHGKSRCDNDPSKLQPTNSKVDQKG